MKKLLWKKNNQSNSNHVVETMIEVPELLNDFNVLIQILPISKTLDLQITHLQLKEKLGELQQARIYWQLKVIDLDMKKQKKSEDHIKDMEFLWMLNPFLWIPMRIRK